MEMKICYHECVMYLFLGNQSDEQQKMGEKLCYYQASLDKLNEAIKLSKVLMIFEINYWNFNFKIVMLIDQF